MTTVQESVDREGFPSVDDTRRSGGIRGEHRGWITSGFSLYTWKVGCTRLMVLGSLKWTAVGLMILSMVNDPTKRGANFRVPLRIWMSFVESYTHWPARWVGAGIRLWSASCFILVKDLDQIGACDHPSSLAPPNECYGRWYRHLLLMSGEQGGLVPQTALWKETYWMLPPCDC